MKLNIPHLYILILILVSCGGPGIVFEPGEATKKLPETTKAVEEMKPVVDRVGQEQKLNDQASDILQNAGEVPPQDKERAIRILSARGNFLRATDFNEEAGVDLCSMPELVITEDLIDDSKILSLGEKLSRCQPQGLAQVTTTSPNQKSVSILIPSLWIAKRFELSQGTTLNSNGQNLTIVTELISLDGILSTKPLATNQRGGHLRIASIKSIIGPNAKIEVDGGDFQNQTREFKDLPPLRQNEIVNSAYQRLYPSFTSSIVLSPDNRVDPLPPSFQSKLSKLSGDLLDGIINDTNLNSDCLRLDRELKRKLKLISSPDQLKLALNRRITSIKWGESEREIFEIESPNHYQIIESPHLHFVFDIKRIGRVPTENELSISPNQVADPSACAGAAGELSFISASGLSRSLWTSSTYGECKAAPEFSAFDSMQGRVNTKLQIKAVIQKFNIPMETGGFGSASSCLATRSPEEVEIQESWPIALRYSAPQEVRGQFNVASKSQNQVQVLRENDVTVDPDLIYRRLEEWNLPREVLVLETFKTFRALAGISN